jgi:hypothetical protein
MSLRALNQAAMDRQTQAAGLDAAVFARALIAGGGDWGMAKSIASKWGMEGEVSPRVLDALKVKAAIGTSGAELADDALVGISSAFLGSLQHVGCFDAMLPSMRQVPMPARYGTVTSGASAYIVGVGGVKPISAFSVTSSTLPALRTVGIVTMSRETARLGGPPGQLANQIIQRELAVAVASTTDNQLLSILLNAANLVSATGTDARSVRRDIGAALSTLTTNGSSKLFVIMRPSAAKALATQFDANGGASFPEMSPLGGRLCGMDALVCDQVPAGDLVLVDAAQVAAASEGVEFRVAEHASLQFNTAPESPVTASSAMLSLWQHNLLAVAGERYWAAAVMGSDAVAVIQNSSYGDSPAP